MTVRTRLVLATLCVFNGLILTVLGLGALVYVDRPAGLGVASAIWIAAAGLFVIARRLRDDVEWR